MNKDTKLRLEQIYTYSKEIKKLKDFVNELQYELNKTIGDYDIYLYNKDYDSIYSLLTKNRIEEIKTEIAYLNAKINRQEILKYFT